MSIDAHPLSRTGSRSASPGYTCRHAAGSVARVQFRTAARPGSICRDFLRKMLPSIKFMSLGNALSKRSGIASVAGCRDGIEPLRTCERTSGGSQASSIAPMPTSIICCRKNDWPRPVNSANSRNLCSICGLTRTATTFR